MFSGPDRELNKELKGFNENKKKISKTSYSRKKKTTVYLQRKMRLAVKNKKYSVSEMSYPLQKIAT